MSRYTFYVTMTSNPPTLFLSLFDKNCAEYICQIYEFVKGKVYLTKPIDIKKSISEGIMISGFPHNCCVKMYNKENNTNKFDIYFGKESILNIIFQNREITLTTEKYPDKFICSNDYNGGIILSDGELNYLNNISNRLGWGFQTEYFVKINNTSHRLIAGSYHKENKMFRFEYLCENSWKTVNVRFDKYQGADIEQVIQQLKTDLENVKLVYGYNLKIERDDENRCYLYVKDCHGFSVVEIPLSENFQKHRSLQK